MIILVSENDADLFAAAKKRLSEIIIVLDTPSDFFIECINKKQFFGIKELFIKKAQEFNRYISA